MTVIFSRQDFTNHVRANRVLEHHVTSNPFSPFFFFSLCVVRVMWEMCCGPKGIANVVENILFWIPKNWQKAQRCRGVSLMPQTLHFVVLTTANICFAFVHHSETPDEFCATKR